MELYDFNRNNQEQRVAYVWQQGLFIADRVSGSCTICLYHMGSFFAEIWYRVADNQIDRVRGFKSISCLEPYLKMVDLFDVTR